MDFGLAFSFPFQDQQWVKKLLITAALCLIPIVGWIAVLGWSLEVTRRVIRQHPEPLPDWSEFGALLTLGFKGFLIGIIFSIPAWVISLPSVVVSALGQDSQDMQSIITIVSICSSCVSILYSIILAFATPAAYGELAATDQLMASINPSRLLQLVRAAPSAWLIAILGTLVGGIVASLGLIACIVGVFFTIAYYAALAGHLYGQAYRQATAAPAPAT
jgi:high-affinity nickel permease